MRFFSKLANSLIKVYRPPYLALNMVSVIVYYLALTALIRSQNYNILLITVPKWLFYAVIISASIMLTLGVYITREAIIKKRAATTCGIGTALTLFTGVVAGCGCSAPLIYGIAVIGLSITEVSVLQSFIVRYSTPIFVAVLAINTLLVLYYAGKVQR